MLTYDEVLRIAVKAHEGQIDKTGLPYILHPVRVAERLRAAGMPLWLIQAGLLHDVIEDCEGYTSEHLLSLGVDLRTIEAVEDVTNDPNLTKKQNVLRLVGRPIPATLKHADSSDNLVRNESLIPEDPVKAASLRKHYEWVLDVLGDSVLHSV